MMFGGSKVQVIKNVVVWLLALLVFADDLVLMAENSKDVEIMIERFYTLSEKGVKNECNKE